MEKKLPRSRVVAVASAGLLLICIQAPPAKAQTPMTEYEMKDQSSHMRHQQKGSEVEAKAELRRTAFNSLPDFTLTDQSGRRVRFYSDLIKGKVVILSFFYTTCTFVCDVQGRNLAKLQARLGNRLGKDVFLISVSRDPATDTPAQLGKWAREYGVRNGWTLVTGDVKDVSKLVAIFLSDTIGPVESHSATIYVGNEATGPWLVSNGLARPEALIGLIDEVSKRRREHPQKGVAGAGKITSH